MGLQNIMYYKASLAGLNVKYVDARNTSSLCPICGGKLSPNEYRLMRCRGCGLKEDRDVVAVGNLLRRYQMDAGASPRKPSHETRGEDPAMEANARPEWSKPL
jgi:putative transposase